MSNVTVRAVNEDDCHILRELVDSFCMARLQQ